jgi:hypothetical protein
MSNPWDDIPCKTWEDLAKKCPICDEASVATPSYYGQAECPNGHYSLSSGNYHTDAYVDGEWVAHFDEGDDSRAEESFRKAVYEARQKWFLAKKSGTDPTIPSLQE